MLLSYHDSICSKISPQLCSYTIKSDKAWLEYKDVEGNMHTDVNVYVNLYLRAKNHLEVAISVDRRSYFP